MNEPERFQQGEILSASRLNDVIDYSRGQYASIPGKDFDLFGGSNANAGAQKRFERIVLVRAREDFEIRITNCATADDIPSGRVDLPRIIPQVNAYEVPTSLRPDFVYDPVAGLSGGTTKSEGDYFHAVFNEDSGRWEVLSGPSIIIVKAVVLLCLGDGWHEVEITDWAGEPDTAGSVSASTSSSLSSSASVSASDADPCDVCALVDESDANCETLQDVIVSRTTGTPTGEVVYAHTTRLMPMMVGGLIKMVKRVPTSSASASASVSASDALISDRLYDVVDGVWPLMALPFPQYDCCTDPVTGEQSVQVVGCTRVVVEAYDCPTTPTPCPTGSASASV